MPRALLNVSGMHTTQNQGGGSKKAGLVPTETASVISAMSYRIRGLPNKQFKTLERNQAIVSAAEESAPATTEESAAEESAPAPAVEDALFSQIKQTLSIDYESGSEEADNFGYSVSVSGNRAIVGAFTKDEEGYIAGNLQSLNNAGAAYIFEYDSASESWSEMQKLVTPNISSEVSGNFGTSVSIMGDYAVVGAPGKSDNDGAVYIFKYDNDEWKTDFELFTMPNSNTKYGQSVDIYGDSVIIGGLNYKTNSNNNNGIGKVEIFTLVDNSWSYQNKIEIVSTVENDRFGETVSISENYAIVGAYKENTAYIYKRENGVWNDTPLHTLTSPNPTEKIEFGSSVSISNNHAIVSDKKETDTTGAVYVYDLNTSPLAEPQRFSKESPHYDFGHSVSVSGNNMIVGTSHYLGQPNFATIYTYDDGTWTESQVIESDAYRFGYSVSITDNHAIVGASGPWNESGSAHIIG